MRTFAAIDTGTQTIRLLVAEKKNKQLFPLYRDRLITSLGRNTSHGKNLMKSSIIRSAECIEDFVKKAGRFNPEEILITATACVREAENRQEFVKIVYNKTGITPKVISGKMEALLTVCGVQSTVNTQHSDSVIMDTGGGSTEFVLCQQGSVVVAESLCIGVLRLTEKYLKHDPPLLSEMNSMQEEISTVLESASSIIRQYINSHVTVPFLTATAGTATTLASMDLNLNTYNPARINGHVLSVKKLEILLEKMSSEPFIKRIQRPGLESGRGKVIIPGTAILLTTMKLLGCTCVTVSDAGLLEGIILNYSF